MVAFCYLPSLAHAHMGPGIGLTGAYSCLLRGVEGDERERKVVARWATLSNVCVD
jgi:hypothetical protein